MDLKGFQIVYITDDFFFCQQCGDNLPIKLKNQLSGLTCLDCHRFNRRCNYYANKERDVKRTTIYNKTTKFKVYAKSYYKKKRKEDIQYKLSCNLRRRVNQLVKFGKKAGSAVKDLDCTLAELKTHLETSFTEGMTWDNYGKWHVDHIKPLSKFDLTDREQFLEACHYTNLQALWAADNLKKSDN